MSKISTRTTFGDEVAGLLVKYHEEREPLPAAIPPDILRQNTLKHYAEIKFRIFEMAKRGLNSYSLTAILVGREPICEDTLAELLKSDDIAVSSGPKGSRRAMWGPNRHSDVKRNNRAAGREEKS